MIVTLPLARASHAAGSLVGGKAASLGELLQAGQPVPDGFVVTTAAFVRHIEAAGATALLHGALPSSLLLAELRKTPVDGETTGDVLGAFRTLFGSDPNATCAVRSSAVGEDGATTSFAGQHSTYYHVGVDALIARIVDCWLSVWSSHASAYRVRSGAGPPSMAVIVQRMVAADVSGVAFTRDPTGADDSVLVIESCWGLGAALVDGRVSPDRYRVTRDGLALTERHIGDKQVRVVEPNGPSSSRLEQVPRTLRRRATLTNEECTRVATLALECERLFGSAQDVEFAISGGETFLLQSRPITGTTTPSLREPDGRWVIFKPVFENFTGPLTPLSVDLLRRIVPPLGRFIDGRWYMSFGVTRALVPLDVSDRTVIDLALLRTPEEAPTFAWRRAFLPLIGLVVLMLTWGILLVRTRYLDERLLEQFRRRSAALLADGKRDVLATLRALTLQGPPLLPIGAQPFAANLASARFFVYQALLRAYATRFVPTLDEPALAALCAPGREIASMRLLADLDTLAATARATPRVARILAGSPDRDVLLRIGAMPEGATFVAAFEQFVATYGHRGVREIELGAPRWAEDPASLIPLVRARLAGANVAIPPNPPPVVIVGRIHRAIVNALARRARHFGALRENTRQFHVLALTTVRRKILALEQQLLQRGRLKCGGDIFFLDWEEIRALDAERIAWQDVEARVRSRRLVHRTRDARLPPLTFNVPYAPPRSTVGELTGTCACAGEAIGPARIVLDPTSAELAPGDILVAPYTDPSWTPLFPLVAAIVVETGSYLSHAGTVARELGVPCIVDVEGCLKRIPNGARVHVRATAGVVAIVGDEVMP